MIISLGSRVNKDFDRLSQQLTILSLAPAHVRSPYQGNLQFVQTYWMIPTSNHLVRTPTTFDNDRYVCQHPDSFQYATSLST